ncbi:MAG: PIN domain-containing protein [Tepidiformaceae bacterium]
MGPVTSEVLDSTILIDHLNGISAATAAIAALEAPAISVMTWIEVVAGLRDAVSERRGRQLLSTLPVIPLSEAVAEAAVVIRRARPLKLPDAVILATARHLGCPLVTRNTRDFPAEDPDVRVPYVL